MDDQEYYDKYELKCKLHGIKSICCDNCKWLIDNGYDHGFRELRCEMNDDYKTGWEYAEPEEFVYFIDGNAFDCEFWDLK